MKQIGLIDCNNFFVSCERLFRPDLQHRPVVVLSSNDGCVVARSQEIKDKGIPMGVPYFQIKDTLSDMGATVFSSNFTLYRDISERVFNVLRQRLGTIEQYSIDECFFVVESADPFALASELKQLIYQQVGIPVSVGIGASKTQAKYASGKAKKTKGVCILSGASWQDEVETIPLGQIWGVGQAHSRSFTAYGLKSVGDFLRLTVAQVGQLFGVDGVRLWKELKGDNSSLLESEVVVPKSTMSSRSFAEASTDKAVLAEALSYHLYEVVKSIYKTKTKIDRLRVLLYPSRHSPYAFYGSSVEARLTVPSNDIFALEKIVMDILGKHFKPGVPYKKVGVCASLKSTKIETNSLFSGRAKTADLTETLLSINRFHGKTVMRLGSVGVQNSAWLARRGTLSPAYTTNWSSLRTVKA